ncbi:H+ transporting ATP synthase subunit d [Operophtera brumata]|uniref:H+ transporting ATP synthase subunit d n=1 Tax=Operophtera brumata TaxID=104452 RepID=A0A0L7K411_OPEBR|nr:H+ transporting ATP synthase subunit d [Operophtera brumata]
MSFIANFQGPTQYNETGQVPQSQGPYQSQAQSAWAQQGQGQTKQLAYDKSYDERRLAMDKPQAKPAAPPDYEKRRFSPPRGRPASPESASGMFAGSRFLTTAYARQQQQHPVKHTEMAKRFTKPAINWAELEKRVPPEQKANFLLFKGKADGYLRRATKELARVNALPKLEEMTMEMFYDMYPDQALDPVKRPSFWPHTADEQEGYVEPVASGAAAPAAKKGAH